MKYVYKIHKRYTYELVSWPSMTSKRRYHRPFCNVYGFRQRIRMTGDSTKVTCERCMKRMILELRYKIENS